MKEATSETSNSIVVIICVAILIAIFSYTIWPIIKGVFEKQTTCDKAQCIIDYDNGEVKPPDNGYVTCYYGEDNTEITCPYKG